jgi:peptidoglycan/xylan/chitin deacetylase (PgdA/CDA1 family)
VNYIPRWRGWREAPGVDPKIISLICGPMKKFLLIIIISFSLCSVNAQSWNGKQCAVVLTYDDGLTVHLTNAIPALDSLKLKATFYISNYTGLLNAQTPEWRKAAAKGHELANHTMRHPCEGGRPGREFVKPENDLNNYSVKRMIDDILLMNDALNRIDGKTERTFAYPCGDTKIHDTAYLDPIKDKFVAARGVSANMPLAKDIDLYDVSCQPVNNETGDQLIQYVKQAMNKKALLVFLFHGVGGGHSLDVSLDAHRALLRFLKQNEKDIWNTTMVDAGKFVRGSR